MDLFDKGYKAGAAEVLNYLYGFVEGCKKATFANENERLQWVLEEIEEKLKEIDEA